MNAARPFARRRADTFTQALFPVTSRSLFDLEEIAKRAAQREADELAERFTEAQRGKPQRVNVHDA